MFKRSVFAAAAIGMTVSMSGLEAPAHATANVKVGELSCHVASGWSFVFGSSRNLLCTYTGNGQVAHYAGDISKFGVDIGYLQSGVLVWDVLAPTTTLGPGALSGNYGGVTAGATIGVGADANALIGGQPGPSLCSLSASRGIRV